MSLPSCDKCGRRFKEGDHIRFVGLSTFHAITSKAVFAIDKPYDYERLDHYDCYETEEA